MKSLTEARADVAAIEQQIEKLYALRRRVHGQDLTTSEGQAEQAALKARLARMDTEQVLKHRLARARARVEQIEERIDALRDARARVAEKAKRWAGLDQALIAIETVCEVYRNAGADFGPDPNLARVRLRGVKRELDALEGYDERIEALEG